MGVRVSTGRGTRVRHSTGMEWDDLERAKKHHPPMKYSTGENAAVSHSTGTEMDYRYIKKLRHELLEAEESEEEEKLANRSRGASRLSSIPDHAQEDTTYLDLWTEQRRQAALGRFEEVETERNTPPGAQESVEEEVEGRTEKKASKGQFRAADLEY